MHNAALYEHANALQRRDTADVLREFSPKLKWRTSGGPELVLDVGCGSGDVTHDLLAPTVASSAASAGAAAGSSSGSVSAGSIVAVDLSNEMIQHAKDK